MTDMISIVTLGFLLGMRHATDADHVVAVATIVSRERVVRMAAWIGALWGIGHTVTIVAVGTPIVLLNWVVAPRIGLAMEFAVGAMLIFLGLRNLTGMDSSRTPEAPIAQPNDPPHGHVHASDLASRFDQIFGGLRAYSVIRPLVIGVVHGLAGSAAIALLVLTTIRDPRWAVAYLIVFGAGTVAGMIIITTAIAYPFARAGGSTSDTTRGYVRLATGLLSVAFGAFIAYRIGIVDGLFSEIPHFTPN